MTEPTIVCPKCRSEIKLTESLAAPLIESTKKDFEKRLAQRDVEITQREQKLSEKAEAIAKDREQLEAQVAKRLQSERTQIAAEEARKAKTALSADLDEKAREVTDLRNVLKQRDEKLAEAQQAQAQLIQKQRELDDAKREMELTIQKRVQDGLSAERDKGRKLAEEELQLKVTERELTIASMQKQIEVLRKKAEQGSQQLQGEAQEIQLESALSERFPHDLIEAVRKGEHGGDVIQSVVASANVDCGKILWESKRTKSWSDGWLPKLRDDQRTARAEIAVIVSTALPKGVETFDQVDGVWITHPRALIPVAVALRQTLIEVNCARTAISGLQTKTEMMYQYLTGPRFRLRMQAIVEAFTGMADDLAKEKKAIMKQWAKREEQIARVVNATVGMYGEMQGIAGKSLSEIEGLGWNALEGGSDVKTSENRARF